MKKGDQVKICRASQRQFPRYAAQVRKGVVRRVRADGMVAIRWDGLSSDQIFHPDHLEIVSN